MRQLIKRGDAIADDFAVLREVAGVADLPDATPAIVPLAFWREHRALLVARGDTGVWLAPDDDPAEIAADVRLLPVVAIDFPSLTDGRGYSTARLLRERYEFKGELRAIGDVQRDQLSYLHEVGFDAFAVRDDEDVINALFGLHDFTDGYQHTAVRTPWFRRRAAAAPPGDDWFPCA
jgi:uncharacterized protein (DUF934 family)